MLDFPAHDAQVVMKSFVSRTARTREPRAYRGLLVKARCVCLDTKKRDQIFVSLDAKRTRSFECPPQPGRKHRIVGELRLLLAQIGTHAFDKPFGVNIGERRNLLCRQFKHADAAFSVRR